MHEPSWVVLVKPEAVRGGKGDNSGSGGGSVGSSSSSSSAAGRSFINVRYPTKDTFRRAHTAVAGGIGMDDSHGAGSSGIANFDDLYNLTFNKGALDPAQAQPMCVHLLAPLQLCNVVSQPLLYRLANKEGVVSSEGVILPGEIVDIHSLYVEIRQNSL
jgi:hypothetical protein